MLFFNLLEFCNPFSCPPAERRGEERRGDSSEN
jgi:hypothetical protein